MPAPDFSDPDLPLSELFTVCPQAASVFLEHRMLCPCCPVARFHGISDACAAYGMDQDSFRARLAQARQPQPRRPIRKKLDAEQRPAAQLGADRTGMTQGIFPDPPAR